MTPEHWKRICLVLDRVLDAPAGSRASVLADACRETGLDEAEASRFLVDETRHSDFLSGIDPAVVSRVLGSADVDALAPGTRLGVFEIVGSLGSGGMGDVYRARDTTLRRDVALKLLPPLFVNDSDRLARFTREAHALASLSHPNIAAIHGLHDDTDARALVLELVEGATLAERLARGPMPLDQALDVARQTAVALSVAHEHGIVHRDLKPSNIKVRPDGVVKILDFGLAKFLEPDPDVSDGRASPMAASPTATRVGAIVGTAAYLAPEQARGDPLDKRADIWAFGCVVYEMLTGTRPFPAESVSDTIALVLSSEPDWSALPAATPLPVRRLLRRCLAKDLRYRLADISDARLDIEDALASEDGEAGETAAVAAPRRAVRRWPWAIAASLMALAAWWLWLRPMPPPSPVVVRFTAPGPTNRPSLPALSRDGSQFAFQRQGPNPDGALPIRALYIRRMDELEPRPLAGTDGAMDPAFSPDGNWLAFLTSSSRMRTPQLTDVRQLKKILVSGGTAQTLVEGIPPGPTELTWTDDGWIYFTSLDRVLRVRSSGGAPETVVTVDHARGEYQFNAPQPLPGGGALLLSVATNSDRGESRVVVIDVATAERRTLLEKAGVARYAPSGPGRGRGHLVYGWSGALFAVAFDANRRQLLGSPVRVVDGVRGLDVQNASFGFSPSGTLVYIPDIPPEVSPVWIDRQGSETALPIVADQFFTPTLAPDDRRVAVLRRRAADDPQTDVWVLELGRGAITRLSFEGDNGGPVWTPDGKQLIHVSETSSHPHAVVAVAADGSGRPRVLLNPQDRHVPMAVTPDGRTLVTRRDTGTGAARSSAYLTLSLPADDSPAGTPALLFESRFALGPLSLSPDGEWAAYQSGESGREEIYVVPFPAVDRKWQVSIRGGMQPVWSRSGRELFYRNRDEMMVVRVEASPTFRGAPPEALLSEQRRYRPVYDVDRTGNRFLMLKLADRPPGGFRVVVNWFEELRRRARAN